jgi:hypothetical protein
MFVINTVSVTAGTSVPARGRLVTKQDFSVPTHDLRGQSYTFSNLNEGNIIKAPGMKELVQHSSHRRGLLLRGTAWYQAELREKEKE